MGEVALTGGSAALKKAASKKIAQEVGKGAAKAAKQKVKNRIKRELRTEARNIASKTPKQLESTEKLQVHHINTLDGHPLMTKSRPYKFLPSIRKGNNLSPFPTLGVERLANNKHNLAYVTELQHKKLHQRAHAAELFISNTMIVPTQVKGRVLRISLFCLAEKE